MAAFEVLALDPTTPQIRAPGAADTYSFPRAITPSGANVTPFTLSGYSLTGANAQSMFDLSGTWNTTGTPTAIKFNITDTASNAASLLMDLQVGGTTRFGVLKDGNVYLQGGASTHFIANSNGGGLACNSFGTLNDGAYDAVYTGYGVRFSNACTLGWASTSTVNSGGGTPDTVLVRDAANTLAQRNGTNAQAFNVYNTFTDASNYERGKIAWSSNVLQIGYEVAGTGSSSRTILIDANNGAINFRAGFNNCWQISSTSHLFAIVDNSFDIGASAANRPRTVFAGTSVLAPYVRTSTAYTVATLPAAGTAGAGARAFVTDATVTIFLSTVAGGGANKVPVVSDGTNWLIG